MTGTWVTDLTHLLDEEGDIAPHFGPGLANGGMDEGH